jgi:ABC-type amino acid transport system permease subunit
MLGLAAAAAPVGASAQTLTPGGVFMDAHPLIKLIMVALLVATVAAVVVGVMKLRRGAQLNGGSAFLSALRFGGPVLGLLGASYVGLLIFLGIANMPGPVPMKVLAPGFAEMVLLIALGLLAGAVATAFNWAVEARIDRQVLRP